MAHSSRRLRSREASRFPGRGAARGRLPLLLGLGFAAGVAGVIAIAVWSGGSSAPERSTLDLPDGPARAGDVEAPQAVVDLGHVPLDTVVEPSFVLRNTGEAVARLGVPRVEVLEGC